jgi:hypothetical protein
MYIKQTLIDCSPTEAARIKVTNAWQDVGINIFAKMNGGAKEYRVKVGSDTYTVFANKSTDINVPVNRVFSRVLGTKLEYGFVTKDGSQDCGALILNIDKKLAYVSIVYGVEGCVVDLKDKVGTTMLRIMLEWCRLKGVTQVYLDDESKYHCVTDDIAVPINLMYAYTLTNGEPWCFHFGFRFVSQKSNQNAEHNRQLFAKLQTGNVDKQDLMEVIDDKMQEFMYEGADQLKHIGQLYDEYREQSFGAFLKAFQYQHCVIFSYRYREIYQAVGYKALTGTYMVNTL